MFKITPKIFAHVSATDKQNYVVQEHILHRRDDGGVDLFHRYCPHRRYPMHNPGDHVDNIYCKFHGFEWDKKGIPINNEKKLHCGTPTVGRSGLVFKDFVEPDHRWIEDLASEQSLEYSHCYTGKSHGSWLWLMDAEADLLHLHLNGIHPFLSKQVSLDDITTDQGDGWIYQEHPDGWWVYVYPYTFIEYGRPGCVMVNTVIPENVNSEYGFNWITQFYYDLSVNVNRRMIFETLESVFKEDVATAELQKGDYFPVINAVSKYEDHCVHFGQWWRQNKLTN
jgi:phenylpropionate dioxygenase-like ring-hydroxylating dioxygenase large terminal subunit